MLVMIQMSSHTLIVTQDYSLSGEQAPTELHYIVKQGFELEANMTLPPTYL